MTDKPNPDTPLDDGKIIDGGKVSMRPVLTDAIRFSQAVLDVKDVVAREGVPRGLFALEARQEVDYVTQRALMRLTARVLAHHDHQERERVPFRTTAKVHVRAGLWQPWALGALATTAAAIMLGSLPLMLIAAVYALAGVIVLATRPAGEQEVPVIGTVTVTMDYSRTFPDADLDALGVHLGDGRRRIEVSVMHPVAAVMGEAR